MQDNGEEGTTEAGPGGIPASALGQMIEAMGSRRMLLGSLFGAMAGGLPLALSRPAAAAPPEVKGSANIPIKVFNNTSGVFVLFADGSITNADPAVTDPPTNPSSYAAVTRFGRRNQTANHAKGSPNVAVDILQDESGTYVLFADGTFRQPPGKPGASGYGTVEYFYGKTYHGTIANHSDNLTVSGPRVRFKHPFRQVPFLWAYRMPEAIIMMNGFVGFTNPTVTEWDSTCVNSGSMEGGFFGVGLH